MADVRENVNLHCNTLVVPYWHISDMNTTMSLSVPKKNTRKLTGRSLYFDITKVH